MAAIFNSAILNLAIWDSTLLVFPLKVTHTCQDWFPPFAPKKLNSYFPLHQLHKINFTHSFWLNCDDGSHLEFCHHGFSHFAQKNFTHSFWLNLVMATILNSAMLDSDSASLDSDTLLTSLIGSLKNTLTPLWLWLKLIQSDSNSFILISPWWWQPSWILPSLILPSWIQPS